MCNNCEEFVDSNTYRCYMKPIERRKRRRKRKRNENEEGHEYLFFDIESSQDEGQHIGNFLIVQDEMGFETVFKGDECVNQFITWLLDGTHQGAIVIAHNLPGYDGFLICEQFYKECILPKLILSGAKIMSMDLEEAEIKFGDSLNFLPMPLKALAETFGLTGLKKGYFNHFFSRKENQNYIGPIPPLEDYDPDSKKTKELKKFLKWHEDLKKNEYVFDFEKEIEEHCRSDVDILRRCYLNFRQLTEETCDLDPFKHCITIASACNRVLRQQFLEENTIGLIPPQGYQPAHKYSILALQ